MDFISVAGIIGKIADKIWPDPTERAAQQVRLLELQQAGDFKAIDSELEAARLQTDTNREEAKHGSLFVAGWRPFVGWVCGSSLAYTFIVQPLLQFACVVGGLDFDPGKLPNLDGGELSTVLLGMLGLGGLRTYEKTQGVQSTKLK